MHRIDDVNADVGNLFKDGDGTPQNPPTNFNAAWANAVQEELCNAITGTGASLNPHDNTQLWTALQNIGFRCLKGTFTEQSHEVDVSDFAGSTALFVNEQSFSIVGTLRTRALLIVIPLWNSSSAVTSISFTYGSQTVTLSKWQMFLGFANNGGTNLEVLGVRMIMSRPDGGINVPYLATETFSAMNRIDSGVVRFAYSDEVGSSGLEEWREWQLKSLWGNNQVKKVLCTNDSEVSVPCFKKDDGSWNTVKFKPGVYKEFICVGSCVVEISGVNYEFAVLAVNGTAGA